MNKREDYISWNDYFMSISILSGMRSKDPSTQVGACIVDGNNRIISIGYNGFVNGCSDEDFPWAREGEFLETKYPYVVHAEQNAILNARGKSLEGCRIYVNLFPCHECARNIIQSGIKEVYYLSNKYEDTDSIKASQYMFSKAGVKQIQLTPNVDKIEINLK
ncbi:MAG: dCMP deaminase family protein [Clostridium sp.]|uniref:deoxycytidylate deaminase n=1 Tax=Clostridium culturomicium TaxID=1499683 RepID=UPI000590CF2E|nr:dCMP deaminase family protein [Clostridium culturomicium]MDU4890766.1 dCMP deaminase family protein [Clostridium sp.]MDU7082272.1 dCMP deaminase family protein [Clostridium sp.]